MKNLKGNLALVGLLCILGILTTSQTAYADYRTTLNSIEQSVNADNSLGAHNIEIVYRQGDVILKGVVASEADRNRIVNIARHTAGVENVTDWLMVSSSSPPAPMARYSSAPIVRDDSEIAAAVRSAISTDDQTIGRNVTVSVRDGIATLRGDLKSFREVDQVLATTLMVTGVRDISSELTINGRSYDVQKFMN